MAAESNQKEVTRTHGLEAQMRAADAAASNIGVVRVATNTFSSLCRLDNSCQCINTVGQFMSHICLSTIQRQPMFDAIDEVHTPVTRVAQLSTHGLSLF